MIVGSGLIGSAFSRLASTELLDNFIIFASGVSNSSNEDVVSYEREKKLLYKTLNENKKPIIYFSSILAPIVDIPYYKHKLVMENLVKKNCKEYLIFRIPQVIGFGGNEKCLFNFLKTSIVLDKIITTNKTVERSIIDVDDLVYIVDFCKTDRGIISLSKIEKIKVVELCNIIGKFLNKQPLLNILETNSFDNWFYENSELINIALKELNIKSQGYTERLVRKYI